MRISQTSSTRPSDKARGKGQTRGTDGAGFGVLLDQAAGASESAGAGRLSGVGGIGLGALLGLAPEPDDQPRDPEARARARAHCLLDHLEEVRLALLTGLLPADRLSGLVDLAQSARAEVTDPALSEILDEVDLRAQVELAKLERYRTAEKV